jgi:hypothetical protein
VPREREKRHTGSKHAGSSRGGGRCHRLDERRFARDTTRCKAKTKSCSVCGAWRSCSTYCGPDE